MYQKNNHKPENQDFAQWLQFTPLLYSYLSMHEPSQFYQMTNARWAKSNNINTTLKFVTNFIYTTGSLQNSKGLLVKTQIMFPKNQQQSNNEFCQPSIKKVFTFQTQSQITKFDQITHNTKNLLTLGVRNNIELLDAFRIKQGIKQSLSHKNFVTVIKNNYQFIGSGDQQGYLYIWDLHQQKANPMKQHQSAITDIQWFSPNQNYSLATSSIDGNVLLWDLRIKQPVKKIRPNPGEIYSLCCLGKDILLSGGSEGFIKLFDLRAARTYTFKQHQSKITKLLNLNDTHAQKNNLRFMSSSSDSKSIIWNDKVDFVHGGHEGPVNDIDFDKQNKYIITLEGKKCKFMIWKP